jgi:hypothetical protein
MARRSRADAYADPDAYRFRDDLPSPDDDYNDHMTFKKQMLTQVMVPTPNDCNAIAHFAVTAGLIELRQAEGCARTLMRSFQASPTGCKVTTPATTFTFQPITYTAPMLRAVAVMIDAATNGHEDPTIQSQRIIAAILAAT